MLASPYLPLFTRTSCYPHNHFKSTQKTFMEFLNSPTVGVDLAHCDFNTDRDNYSVNISTPDSYF